MLYTALLRQARFSEFEGKNSLLAYPMLFPEI